MSNEIIVALIALTGWSWPDEMCIWGKNSTTLAKQKLGGNI
jgi:hypothetical protein